MRIDIHYVNLEITTFCDQRCPNCCSGIGINRVLQHHPWEYFKKAAKALHGIYGVNLTGGEPTFHPQFAEFLPKFKALFGCRQLTMNTNGWGVERYLDLIIEHLDCVDYSDYHKHPGATTAMQHLVTLGRANYFDAGRDAEHFIPRTHRGSTPCERAWWRSGRIGYGDGRIFGCCAAMGVDGAASIEPAPGWDKRMPAPPCGECLFADAK